VRVQRALCFLPLFGRVHKQKEQGADITMASKREVEKSLAEKPHGYEFLGPYVHSHL
jgi:hypothetical protein